LSGPERDAAGPPAAVCEDNAWELSYRNYFASGYIRRIREGLPGKLRLLH
jgi:hypothetical protein